MKSYYVAGGTMLVSDASYVVRDADYLLRDRLVDGDFCYVLTPRQMGKSSLMVQTAHALRDQGVASVTLDLSKHGFTLDAGQWYDGLLEMIGYGLGLEDEIETLISDNADRSPLQRWQKAIRNVVLERISGSVVLFLDEIDITRRFNFETDEFFAAIRACYGASALVGAVSGAAFSRGPIMGLLMRSIGSPNWMINQDLCGGCRAVTTSAARSQSSASASGRSVSATSAPSASCVTQPASSHETPSSDVTYLTLILLDKSRMVATHPVFDP